MLIIYSLYYKNHFNIDIDIYNLECQIFDKMKLN